MVVYYYEAECHAEKMVHYLQDQGHCEGLCNQNTTISTISSKTAGPFATKLGLIVKIISQSVLWENGLAYCIHGEGHSEASRC